ncbi:hypothetical protein STXM2123_3516 [Streptomyces sp. F-3]|nr:hypothetical protein STXM2123_3516 [Streptomyces sp. F-3]
MGRPRGPTAWAGIPPEAAARHLGRNGGKALGSSGHRR